MVIVAVRRREKEKRARGGLCMHILCFPTWEAVCQALLWGREQERTPGKVDYQTIDQVCAEFKSTHVTLLDNPSPENRALYECPEYLGITENS